MRISAIKYTARQTKQEVRLPAILRKNDIMSEQSDILVVIAHPDDETFISGTLCLCAERGFSIALACVSDGDGGYHDLLPSNLSVRLAEIRRRELELSAMVLGIANVIFLGQADVADPGAAGARSWDQEKVTGSVARLIEELRPELILTHGPLGGYGHPVHRMVHEIVMKAVRQVAFSGSVFSFCGQVNHAFFSWHFDEPSDVVANVRDFLRRRSASLSYHQSQIDYFLRPHFPRSLQKYLSASFGYLFSFTAAGRKRVPIATASRFFGRFPLEGLVLQKRPEAPHSHFFIEHFRNDPRVMINANAACVTTSL
jgi:LmbE family N-acetylglucosaminyl deacetylase